MQVKVAPPAISRMFGRGTKDAIPGQDAGWAPWSTYFQNQRRTLPRAIKDYLGTYGGTEDSVTWVYACTSLIASEIASYEWSLADEKGDLIEIGDGPEELETLLKVPNRVVKPRVTYFDFMDYTVSDLELAGNSYWLKDNRNKLGQPQVLYRLRPELTRILANEAGLIGGYGYTVKGLEVIYDADEIIHFKYPNPLDDVYGMGTVEAIQRALGIDLAASEHVLGFFSDGARISGILTIDGQLSDPQFERMKRAFREGTPDENQFKVLIAEQGTSFTPITATPPSLGVIEIRQMTKDEILSGFGVPEFLLGGSSQGGIYKMEEAQHIMTRRLMPKSIRVSEQMTAEVVQLWGEELTFTLDQTFTEPQTTKIERAQLMVGAGATANEIRETAGLPAVEDDKADEPLFTAGLVPLSKIGEEPPLPPGFGPPGGPTDEEVSQPDIPPEDEQQPPEEEVTAGERSARPFRRQAAPHDFGARTARGIRALGGYEDAA